MKVNLWVAISTQAITEFKAKRDNPAYSGPMDEVTFKTLSRMHDQEVVMGLFKQATVSGKNYRLFSLYLEGSAKAKDAIDDLIAKWPTHFFVIGAWWMDGRQVGTEWGSDEEGAIITTGTPLYPIPAQAWRVMPDLDGVAATSNTDLRDVNLLDDQQPRRFA